MSPRNTGRGSRAGVSTGTWLHAKSRGGLFGRPDMIRGPWAYALACAIYIPRVWWRRVLNRIHERTGK